jgi:iron complex outermembrane receptor protein
LSISYLDSEITSYTGSDVFDPTAYALGVQDIVGNALPRAPEWSGNAFGRYTWLLDSNGSITLGGNIAYTGDYNHTQFGNVLMTPSYTLYNANVTWTSPSGAFSVNAFGRNLGDEEYLLTSFFTDAFGVLQFPGAPRTYGVQVRYNFN